MTDVRSSAAPFWSPSREQRDGSRVMALARAHGVASYPELVARSQRDPDWFWTAAVEDLGLQFGTPFIEVQNNAAGPSRTTWFTGGRLNLAWNCVGRWAESSPDRVAVVAADEDGVMEHVTYADLWARVRRFAAGMAARGIGAGDRVGLCLPMGVAAVVASHACALLGAVQVPLFTGLAAPAIRERLVDAQVRAVVTVTEMRRKGSPVRLAAAVVAAMSSEEECLVIVDVRTGSELPDDERVVAWSDLDDSPALDEVPLHDSEHPYLLAYTSGTTGRPKGIVHATAGFLVKIAAEAAYQTDVGPDDRLVWFTDLGWLMGIWSIVGCHANGAGVVVFEGVPTARPDQIWSLCEQAGITVLGLSPSLVRSLPAAARKSVAEHDLGSLRILASTGEAWDDDSYRWFASVVGGGRLPVINFSGGTEVGACFLSCSPAHPIKLGSVGLPSLGMAIDVVDAEGATVPIGEGELVCRRPWPGMTRGIWRDPVRFEESYWSQHPGMWTHGDVVVRDSDGHWFVRGRSDDTLNVGGKRIGPSELESVLLVHPAVLEAAVVAVSDPLKGHTPWAFCVLADPQGPGTHVVQFELIEALRRQVGPAFVPSRFLYVNRLPKTKSHKVVRRVLRDVAEGNEPGDLSGLADPEVVARIASTVASR
ncbi:AMP-binding protein [Nocardioides daeguensis]|uniref:AMP-binding protein n=1 Tax=Nocardioides daeguensis TaxID=908359 RepID=A0ABP6W9W3_9ACTN|nr:AMP-binding protein [Nocardioides daeguensis]MBV6729811.1 AMP-binding protein [Nocardioides daeguensis]MCR1775382.1 AMP-binding protein [Nocardioides daeguensis]